jgi:hypothetical protein
MMPCCGGFDCVKLIGMDNGCAEILLPKAMWMNGLRRKDVERFDFDSNKSVLRNPDFSGLHQGYIAGNPIGLPFRQLFNFLLFVNQN